MVKIPSLRSAGVRQSNVAAVSVNPKIGTLILRKYTLIDVLVRYAILNDWHYNPVTVTL